MKHSLKLITVTCLLITMLSACGAPAKGPSLVPASTNAVLASPSAPATGTPSPLPLPSQTLTPAPGPTATETALPTLELSTLEAFEPALDVWDGLPTYIADSLPGYYFRVKFNPRVWGLTQDNYGQPALGHRDIGDCILAPGGVRGMSPGTQVEHDTRQIGKLFFEINTVLINGQRQFVTYQATDKTIFTSFQVNFVTDLDACLKDAEAVLATLTSVPESQATPVTPVP
jgi:hypothetical protein